LRSETWKALEQFYRQGEDDKFWILFSLAIPCFLWWNMRSSYTCYTTLCLSLHSPLEISSVISRQGSIDEVSEDVVEGGFFHPDLLWMATIWLSLHVFILFSYKILVFFNVSLWLHTHSKQSMFEDRILKLWVELWSSGLTITFWVLFLLILVVWSIRSGFRV
jgi:hypothetical protein